jgi:hypothetical protein
MNVGAGERRKVACDDGFEVGSSPERELVQQVPMPIKDMRPKVASRDEILKMATKA